MFRIIKNDLWIMRKYLIFICLYSFFFTIVLNIGVQMLCGISAYMFVIGLLSWEERDKINRMYKLLPVKTSAVVGAKYIETLIISVLSVISSGLVYLCYSCMRFFTNAKGIYPINWIGLIYAVLISVILLSVLIPILYKWGYIKSRIIVILSLVVVFAFTSPIFYVAESLTSSVGNIVLIIGIIITALIAVISEKISEKLFINSDQ